MAKNNVVARDEIVKFRCTSIEKLAIKNKAEQCNLSISEYCRDSALKKKIEFALSDEEIEIFLFFKENFRGLKAISNSWRTGDNAKAEIQEVIREFQWLVNRFK